jgi:hypothetical protein
MALTLRYARHSDHLLTYFPKVRLCGLHPICVSVYLSFRVLEPVFMKVGISWQLSPSVYVCMCIPPIVARRKLGKMIRSFFARQRLGKHVPAATNACNNRRIIGRFIFCAIHVLSKESLWVCLCISLSLLCNNWMKTFPREGRIFGDVVFYAVRVVLMESRLLVLPRTSYFTVFSVALDSSYLNNTNIVVV